MEEQKKKKTIHIGYLIAPVITIVAIILLVVLLPSDDGGVTPTPTATATATATATPTGTPVPTTPPVGDVTISIDSPESVVKASGRYFHAYVSITSVDNFYGAQYDISYDPSVIRVQDVTAGDISGNTIRIEKWSFIPANTQGTLRIINSLPTAMGTSGVSGEGYLADIYFRIYGNPGDFTTISFVEGLGDPVGYLMVGNNEGLEISSTWIDAAVIIE
ncbi:MAG: cohesin domain-containing protein [Dehalococcoidia bacterium]|jgi:hypothetical protein